MGTAAFAVMDPNSSYWQQKLASVATRLVRSTGADALYMDQISASHCESCFEGGRGGGGSSWSAGNRAVLKAAAEAGKRAHGGKPIAISSESMNEQYLGQIGVNLAIYTFGDAMQHCQGGATATRAVPAYSSVYGGMVINMGDNRFPVRPISSRPFFSFCVLCLSLRFHCALTCRGLLQSVGLARCPREQGLGSAAARHALTTIHLRVQHGLDGSGRAQPLDE